MQFRLSENPDEMSQNATIHRGLHCLLEYYKIQSSGTVLHNYFEISTYDPS